MTNTATTTDPALILAGIIRQVDGAHDLSADALASAILAHPGSRWGTAEGAPPPIAPRTEPSKDPPNTEYEEIPQAILPLERLQADLQRRRESQEVTAPTFPHISDSLMRSLICDIVAMLSDATEAALFGNQINPLEEIRARLMEILQLAAQDKAKLHKIDP